MLTMVIALLVIKVMTLLLVSASSQPSTMLNLLMPDVELGTGSIRFALLALTSGFSTPKKFAFLFLISVPLMLKTVIVLLVSRDTTSSMELVSSQHPTMPILLISDVPIGTGIIWSALLVLTSGFSMVKEFVLLSTITALLMVTTVIV